MVDQREIDKIELRVLAEEWSAPPAALAPAEAPETASIEPSIHNPTPAKLQGPMAFALMVVLLLAAIVQGPSIGLLRTQALASIAERLNPQANWYVDNRADLASAYAAAGHAASAEQVYTKLIADLQLPGKAQTSGVQAAYVQLLLSNVYRVQGKYKEATDLTKSALQGITTAEKLYAKEQTPARDLDDKQGKMPLPGVEEGIQLDKKTFPAGMNSLILLIAHFYDENENPGKNANDKLSTALYETALSLWDYAPGCSSKSNTEADLGKLYEKNGNYQKALENFTSAYNVFKQNGNTCYNAYRLEHIGFNLLELHKYEEAEPVLERGLEMTKIAWEGSSPLLYSQVNLARVKQALHKYGVAKALLDSALADSYKLNDGTQFCWIQYYLAQVARDTGDIGGAKVLYAKVLKLLKEDYPGPSVKTVTEEIKNLEPKTTSDGLK